MEVTFGTRLRLQRERKGVPLTSIAEETKISVALLQALERDDVSRWPTGVFRRAYIRAYARAVSLEPETVVREFMAVYPDPTDENAEIQGIAQTVHGDGGSGPSTRIGFLVRTAVAAASSGLQREAAMLTAPQGADDVNSDAKRRFRVRVARLVERLFRFPSPDRVSALRMMIGSVLERGLRRLRPALARLRHWASVLSQWAIQIGLDIWHRGDRDALAPVDLQRVDAVADPSPATRAQRSLASSRSRQPEHHLSTIASSEPTRVEAKPAVLSEGPESRTPRPARLRKAPSADMLTSGFRENRNMEDALASVARLCAALASAQESEEIRSSLADTARVLGARGVILWVWDHRRAALVPALAHGYSEDLLALLPPVGRNTDNAIATAFRSAQTCTVEGRGGKMGAFIAPLLTPKGCGGVLALEFDNGGEKRGSVQAIARIVSTQISSVIGNQPLAHAVSA